MRAVGELQTKKTKFLTQTVRESVSGRLARTRSRARTQQVARSLGGARRELTCLVPLAQAVRDIRDDRNTYAATISLQKQEVGARRAAPPLATLSYAVLTRVQSARKRHGGEGVSTQRDLVATKRSVLLGGGKEGSVASDAVREWQ